MSQLGPIEDIEDQPAWDTIAHPWPLAGYRPTSCLGVGGRCETWLTWDVAGWQTAVVKMVRPDQVTGERARLALDREIAVLVHPHQGLPRLLHDGRGAAVPHLTLEHLTGPDLDETVDDQGALDDVETVALGIGLLAALLTVHRVGRAHCDVKPANVVLRDGRAVLIDFASARVLGSSQPAGRPLGTPGYAAPEMEACAPICPAMDVYGVAVTLAEARTGTSPAQGLWGPEAFTDWPAGAQVRGVIEQMLAPAAADRPSVTASLTSLAALVDPELLPWPVGMVLGPLSDGAHASTSDTLASWHALSAG